MEISVHIRGETSGEIVEGLRGLLNGMTGAPGQDKTGPQTGSPAKDKPLFTPTLEKTDKPAPEKKTSETKPSKSAAAKPAAAEPTPAPAADKKEPEPAPKAKGPTIEDVKSKIRAYLGTFENNAEGQKAASKLLLDEFGVGKVSELDEEQYADAIAQLDLAIEERETAGTGVEE